MRDLRAALCGCVVAVLASGCVPGASAPQPSVPSSVVSSSADAGRTQAPTVHPSQAASQTASQTASPVASAETGIPTGFPVFPGARELPVAGLLARWSIEAEPPDVLAYFLGELPRAGFAILEELPGGDAAIIRFSAADGSIYQLDLTGHDPVQVSLGPPHD